MLTKTQVELYRQQLPYKYQYLFQWYEGDVDYENYLTEEKIIELEGSEEKYIMDGRQLDMNKIKAIHEEVVKEADDYYKQAELTGMTGVGDFWYWIGGSMSKPTQRYWVHPNEE